MGKTTEKYVPKVRDVFWVRSKETGRLHALCAPYKCTKRHSIGKSLISIEARGWSRKRGGTPWNFRVSEWKFEEDGK